MPEPVIAVHHLSKRYRLGVISRKTLEDEVKYVWHKVRGRNPWDHMGKVRSFDPKARSRELELDPDDPMAFWALRDVSFEVKPGEVVGVIGRNGAGKSTLLKILCRITLPTEGEAVIGGRVGSLLEVGTGFHPELTGRENIYMNGTILGMKKAEIDRKFDEIVAFSEIEQFLDTPVKRYSSGMHVRLAFAVAAHLEPEILLVDEVLAVGDVAFQKKCIGKMGEVAQAGRTVLFVSHNMTAVQSLCDRALWLQGGRLMQDGDSQEVVQAYLQSSFSTQSERVWDDPGTAPGNDRVRLRLARVRPSEGDVCEPVTVHTPLDIEFEVWNHKPDVNLHLTAQVINEQGVIVFVTASLNNPRYRDKPFPAGLFRFTCKVPGDLLNNGLHRLYLLIVQDAKTVLCKADDILAFHVADSPELRGGWHGKWVGAVRPNLDWEIEEVKRQDGT